jgi:hypothetical protein
MVDLKLTVPYVQAPYKHSHTDSCGEELHGFCDNCGLRNAQYLLFTIPENGENFAGLMKQQETA